MLRHDFECHFQNLCCSKGKDVYNANTSLGPYILKASNLKFLLATIPGCFQVCYYLTLQCRNACVNSDSDSDAVYQFL